VYRRRRRGPYVVGALLIVLVGVVAAGAIVVSSASTSLSADPAALARVGMPLGGGTIESVTVAGGRTGDLIPVEVRGDQIWPKGKIPAGEPVSIVVVVKRPGWISWLSGSTTRVHLTLTTPRAAPSQTYVTLRHGQPLRIAFDHPVTAVSYGPAATQLARHVLAAQTATVTVPRNGSAGTIFVAGTPRAWETAAPAAISWFPSGAATAAVASPEPGTHIGPTTPITLTFSKPISSALGSSRPPVSPATSGGWQQVGPHTLVFHPTGYGYGLGATVKIGLPSGVTLAGGSPTWSVAPGSTLRLQQLLATLGYLPVNFSSSTAVAATPGAQEQAAITPPAGSFSWRWGNVPGALHSMWQAGTSGEMTKGAVMAFENDQGMIADGVAGPFVWKSLIAAAMKHQASTFGYTFVQVSEGSPESESTWHNGRTVVSGAVNTGIPQAPTAQGVFAVFEHAPSVTMSGTNPDGSHYSDPGVPYVSYFNGGDALHGFLRASYGTAQSLGCVEMPYSEAAEVYPFTPIGTLVDVT
jgi:peptidoglycan hydrolase-like protein with peptidoglycan-binding domain